MPRGGSRPGSGRPPGSPNQRTRAVAARAAAEGVSPIEVMLTIMRDALAQNDNVMALEAARHAAPYCHPRLSAVLLRDDREREIEAFSNPALREFVQAELVELLAAISVDPEMDEASASVPEIGGL